MNHAALFEGQTSCTFIILHSTFIILHSSFYILLLLESVWIMALPTPAILAHLLNAAFSLPAEFLGGEGRIGPALCDVARTARANLVWDWTARSLLERLDDLQHAVAMACAEVVNLEAELRIRLELFDRLEVANGEVNDVDVVANASTVNGGIVIAEYVEFGEAANGDLRNIRQEVVRDSGGIFADLP